MTVTDLRCWSRNQYVGDFFRYIGDFLNVPLRYKIGHQHLMLVTNTFGLQHPSPTFMSPSILYNPLGHLQQNLALSTKVLLQNRKWFYL